MKLTKQFADFPLWLEGVGKAIPKVFQGRIENYFFGTPSKRLYLDRGCSNEIFFI